MGAGGEVSSYYVFCVESGFCGTIEGTFCRSSNKVALFFCAFATLTRKVSCILKPKWLSLSVSDIETERKQCEEEGRDLSELNSDFAKVLSLDLEVPENQAAAEVLLDKTILTPILKGYAFDEPSDLAGIKAGRPDSVKLPALALSETMLLDKIHGGWTGICVGYLLGKPVKGWLKAKMHGYLKDSGRLPLNDFFNFSSVSEEVRAKYELSAERGRNVEENGAMSEDDNVNCTAMGLGILKKFGRNFTPTDVASFRQNEMSLLDPRTAEREAHRNLGAEIPAMQNASFRNPYREWSGAQIRADFWGLASPGKPELAAEFAWRDACGTHVKNGIYDEMWVAAMISAAFVSDDIPTIIRAGLAQIPEKSRLADSIDSILEWYDIEIDYDNAVYRVHELWNENREHDRNHAIPNAMIVTIALLWGEGDYAKTICLAVQACFDTASNGATVGSVLGVLQGRKSLPAHWTDSIRDTLHTRVKGFETVKLDEMARETLALL